MLDMVVNMGTIMEEGISPVNTKWARAMGDHLVMLCGRSLTLRHCSS